ncbi:MAG: hypothetical protein JNK82_17625 [Myxococcaceae bacterium]|nr:hypothetical protein [Myxococcaceae bacterium]
MLKGYLLVSFVMAQAQAGVPKDAALPVPNALNDAGNQARSFAMGGAYRGMGFGTESVSGNPAMMSMFRRYQLELGGAWDIPNGYGFGGLSIIDSATNELAYGQSYTLVTFDSPYGRTTAHLNTTAMAYPIADWLHIGINARYQLLYGPYATNSITMGAGAAVRLFDRWIIGFSGHNLIGVASPLVNRFFALATSVTFASLTPSFEWRMDFNAPSPRFAWSVGAEFIAGDLIPIRAGFTWDDITGQKYVSGGLGFTIEGSGVDISYRHELEGYHGRLLAVTIRLQSR